MKIKVTFAPEHRFWVKVQKTDGCWFWTGSASRRGYGQFRVGKKTRRAHRYSYELHYGLIPEGQECCHHCDCPACVNPAHLFLGDHKANMSDCSKKGRTCRGTRSGAAKLTDAQVLSMRAEYAAGGVTMQKLASRYGVKYVAVNYIINRKRWSHI